MKKVALIMAGGKGERFWPRSRQSMPKQFLSLTDDDRTMIQLTVDRILPLVAMEDIFVVTNESYEALVREQLPELPPANILCEPAGRNTAPCIGWGACCVAEKYGDAVMMVLPSDQMVQCVDDFRKVMARACDVAEQGENLVTLGIKPDCPETGYGYIKFCPQSTDDACCRVERFVEKPDLETARQYVASGQYLWNSGMFIWKASTILANICKYLPEIVPGLQKIRSAMGTPEQHEVLNREFLAFPSQSIDYGVMEKAENIYTIGCSIGWDDVGSWLAVGRIQDSDQQGNVVAGNAVLVDARNCVVQSENKLVAVVGVEDLIVVNTDDALLVCKADSAGKIKKVLETLKLSDRTEYL
ncbi:mannose-1-phosphate guanylyltransferase [Candidatus Allofournierella merdavium]|uniref:mannose-1-phosphate guanylyltransferase n=1 Tax=Candidatus Allofournierella merdavium TaxID=2838593 RepID=UPI00374E9315